MTVTGKTNRELLRSAESKSIDYRHYHKKGSRQNNDIRLNRNLKNHSFHVRKEEDEPDLK